MTKVYKTFAAEVKAEGDEARLIRFRITTDAVDRERDVLSAAGWKLDHYLKNPVVLWAHDYRQPPIARAREIVSTEHGLSSLAEFPPKGVHPFADTIYDLLKGGFLNSASVGFNPTKPPVYNEERKGYDYAEQELLEFSVVPVPANPEALVEARAAGIDLQPIKKWARDVLGMNLPNTFPDALVDRVGRLEKQILHAGVRAEHGECPMGEDCPMKGKAEMDAEDCRMGAKSPMRGKGLVHKAEDPVRWNRQLGPAFDVTAEALEASTIEYAWASRYLGVPVKAMQEIRDFIPSPRMGSFLSALEETLSGWRVEDCRNITQQGTECPPVHDTIRLRAKEAKTFLVEGTRFMRSLDGADVKLVLKVEPDWSGMILTVMGTLEQGHVATDLVQRLWARARELNFLRGAAFSLSGEFLERGAQDWEDLFLEPVNLRAVRRVVDLLNQ